MEQQRRGTGDPAAEPPSLERGIGAEAAAEPPSLERATGAEAAADPPPSLTRAACEGGPRPPAAVGSASVAIGAQPVGVGSASVAIGAQPAGVGVPIDFRARIRAALAGTQPRHAPEEWLLPGLSRAESQQYRAYFPSDPRPAAVLVPLVEREPEPTVLLTQRATQLRNHAGQISFPGGRIEASDAGPAAAALREAREEIGLDERFVSIIGYLPDHVLLSGFRVTPVVGLVRPGFELLPQPQEVHDTFEVPLSFIFEPANHRLRRRRFGGGEAEVELYDIPYGDRNIWGATAGMLLTLYRACLPAQGS